MAAVIKAAVICAICMACMGTCTAAWSMTSQMSVSGQILNSSDVPVTVPAMQIRLSVLNPAGTCVIFQETHGSIDTTSSAGGFDLKLGTGSQNYLGAASFVETFKNSSVLNCAAGGSFTGAPNDTRKIKIEFRESVVAPWEDFGNFSLGASPYAYYADSAQKIEDYVATDFLLKAGLPSCSAGTFLTWSGTAMTCAAAGASNLTSVGLSMPALFTVTNSPLTSNGNISVTLANAAQNSFFAGPMGAAGTPSFRALDSSDLPTVGTPGTYGSASTTPVITVDNRGRVTSVNSANIAADAALLSGTVPLANGGTGANTAANARTNLGAAASGSNSDITSTNNLTTLSTTASSITISPTGQLMLSPSGNVVASAPILSGLGSAAAPSYGNFNSTSTGMYFPTATDIGFSRNGVSQMVLSANGTGIGTTSPRAMLDVNGAIVGNAMPLAGTLVSFSSGNIQYTTSSCGAFTLHNLKEGGNYILVVKGGVQGTCTFASYSDTGSTLLNSHLPPDHGTTVAGKHTIYNLFVAGGDVYFSWSPGY